MTNRAVRMDTIMMVMDTMTISPKVGMLVQINLHIWRLLQKGQTRGSVERSAGVRKHKTKHRNPATVQLKVKLGTVCEDTKPKLALTHAANNVLEV